MSRIEYDFLGGKEIPDDCYYGVQTLRGKENFHVTEMSMAQEPFFIIRLCEEGCRHGQQGTRYDPGQRR